MRIKNIFLGCALLIQSLGFSQHDDHHYIPDPDAQVSVKLEKWQDLKFGLLMHWGPYSQWGIVESWSICPEDYGWCNREKGLNPGNYNDYVKEYKNLKTSFNPVEFDPRRWAVAAKEAGMRYMIFTTKHHDGFCMFDTRFTDYKITDSACPFHAHPKSNITNELFDAFRAEGLWVGPYFSKPDWNSMYYWDPYFPPSDRNVNYDPAEYPDKWEKFVQFTHNQIMELMTDYGKIDILWLDGGWVAKKTSEEIEKSYARKVSESTSGFIKTKTVNQDIRMDELVERVRAKQPGLIVVDRAVPGKNQNYLTPENRVPEEPLPYPWESCIIAGGSWSWIPDPTYLSAREAIHLLADIVSKGGNLLLNIAPGPEGQWHDGAYQLLDEIGCWMKMNSEAIYETRAVKPYKDGKVCFTGKNNGTVYGIYLAAENENKLPATIYLSSVCPAKGATVQMPGSTVQLKWKSVGSGCVITIPKKLHQNPPTKYAWVFRISEIQVPEN